MQKRIIFLGVLVFGLGVLSGCDPSGKKDPVGPSEIAGGTVFDEGTDLTPDHQGGSGIEGEPAEVQISYAHIRPGVTEVYLAARRDKPNTRRTAVLTGPGLPIGGVEQSRRTDVAGSVLFTWRIHEFGPYRGTFFLDERGDRLIAVSVTVK